MDEGYLSAVALAKAIREAPKVVVSKETKRETYGGSSYDSSGDACVAFSIAIAGASF